MAAEKNTSPPERIVVWLGAHAPGVFAAAKADGITLSRWVRDACQQRLARLSGDAPDAAQKVVRGNVLEDKKVKLEELTKLRSDLGRIGGNLNQIALAFNTKDELDEGHLAIVHSALRDEFKRLSVMLADALEQGRQ